MECTQRLECTQDVYETSSERTCPEQIGFLGICGSKHPIKKGPNKVGRDPQTCGIVLNDNSISRQHAVINILNKKDFMLMDLDSSNKTKLLNKTLDPYIPQPLRNGDTVQFGQVFGIFRLLEDDDDLPMTQAVEIPDTPINTRHISRLKIAPITTVPESPDVSDRDDSIIVQSQPQKTTDFKSQNNKFMKSSGKVVGNQQFGINKIDNVYWNSSKKSDSFSSNFESISFNKKNSVSPKKLSIESSIYDIDTQATASATVNETPDSIYEANTQVASISKSPNINSCETQVPNIDKLPEVFKVQDQNNVQLNLFTTNENFNIYDAETQITLPNKKKYVTPKMCENNINYQKDDVVSCINKKLNSSDEEICFDEIDSQQLEDECGSQPLLPPGQDDIENLLMPLANPELQKTKDIESVTTITTGAVITDSDSKDCDEIAASQVVTRDKPTDDGDETDCEDIMIELKVNNANEANKIKMDDELTDCKDNRNQVNVTTKQKVTNDKNVAYDSDVTDCEDDVIEISQNRSKTSDFNQNIEDLPTQVIGGESPNHHDKKDQSGKYDILFEDMLTQVIEACPIESDVNSEKTKGAEKSVPFEDIQTQVIDTNIPQEQSISSLKIIENHSSFKRPLSSPRIIKKDIKSTGGYKCTPVKNTNSQNKLEDDDNYYDATQQIYNDLCTQTEKPNRSFSSKIENNVLVGERSSEDSDAANGENNSYVSNMTKEQVRKVIGVDPYVTLSTKKSSDSSDLEITPKKFNPSKFLMIDLPNSQEIKSCDFISSKVDATDSFDGFDETEEQNNKDISPVGLHRKRRKKDVKQDLMKKFDIDTLPTRAITRIRKPTSKILNSDDSSKKMTAKILQSNLGLDKDHEVDAEVMQLNLKRLRSKMEKVNSIKSSNKSARDEKNTVSRPVEKGQSSMKTDKKERKKSKLDRKSNEKELKQQNIHSMFTESSLKDIDKMEGGKEAKTDTTDSSVKTRRSCRNKTKDNKAEHINKVEEINSEYGKTKKSSSRTHSNRKERIETIDLSCEDETVVRRSRRQQASKNKNEEGKTKKSQSAHEKRESDKTETLKNIASKNLQNSATLNLEHSRVYNLSSETAVDSPANLKRRATSDIVPSKAKRTKPSNASSVSFRPPSARGNRTQYVLFTAFPCEEVKQKLERLGAVIVSDVKSCTVVLTLQIRRTFKLLCAVGLGRPIVGPNWVQACVDSNMIVDPWLYLMKDEVTEKRFGFNLRQSLTCKRNFLKGHNVFCTPNVSPSAQEMKFIVECSGGAWREGGGGAWFCVTCAADRAQWGALRRRGATLVSTEFILAGVLQQRISLDRDKLE